MQRQAYVPGLTALAAALVLGLTGCSSDSGGGTGAVDSKAGPAAPAAPPGRYRTLFEPCRAVPQDTLRDLLPGAAQLPDEERIAVYRGAPAVTYDTDRRVGCSWKADTPDAMHRLRLDIERVVSYDPAVSDDDRAQEVFFRKQIAANLPQPPQTPQQPQSPSGTSDAPSTTPGATPSGTTSGTTSGTSPSATASGTAKPTDPDAPSGNQTPTGAPTTGLEPRLLQGLGQVAFLDDALSAGGANGRLRTVSVVFRTSNVVVTVEYVEQTTGSADAPDSRELQEKAQNLARLLSERLEE
ncbi:DUF3558 domain-containing protein [Streptomyces sp. Je 1-79]|uniref:DUF3558 domain-containing protein n=1 Tax=Streptomyces sp. Je 1-79 TaxID=2943847 RepID=UPI0021A618A6|nr:DUF3558 domain-containing protein [Streptomyces sp. Je 1-79]MCT4356405.1 DUF3558 domain-containing protein [Streptomyces sp. Je 1-79]